MTTPVFNRRAFLGATALTALGGALPARAAPGETDVFVYAVRRSEAEWRARLTPEAFAILRQGGTELPKTSPLWNETAPGVYCCKGCDLPVYDSVWKVPLDKGWAFFRQSRENAILMGIDGTPPDGMGEDGGVSRAMIEAHCRRCGSHLGHILTVEGETLHCINGTSLLFSAADA